MCGRFALDTPSETLGDLFEVDAAPSMRPRYNIAPTQPVAVVRRAPAGGREMLLVHWGLIPSWSKTPEVGSRMINARSETVAEKPAFRGAFKRRRCLVPTDGFYEWQRLERGKQPYYIQMSQGAPFAFAGLWELWEGPDGTAIESCAILTTEANALVRPIHNRMPVIIDPEDYQRWLETEIPETDTLAQLMGPCPEGRLSAIPVSPWVNNPKNDDPRCLEPFEPSLPLR